MTSLVLTIQPVGALILAALIFGEDPGMLQLLGAVLILLSLSAISSRRDSPTAQIALAQPGERSSDSLREPG